ncbi:MAG: hypothetical protein AAF725_17895, partial [Acidobacteriota bacterium]
VAAAPPPAAPVVKVPDPAPFVDEPFDVLDADPVPVELPDAPPAKIAAAESAPPAAAGKASSADDALAAALASPAAVGKGKQKGKAGKATGFDALAELEKLRKQTLRPKQKARAAGRAKVNGSREIQRELRLEMNRDSLDRARRFSLTLQLEDEDHQPIEESRRLHVDLDPASLDELLLRLNIALRSSP